MKEDILVIARTGHFLIMIVALAFLVAGIGKFLALDDFFLSLESWDIIPKILYPMVSVLVPSLELTLGLLFLARVRVRLVAFGMGLLLVVFTLAFLFQYWAGSMPTCNCLGKIKAFESLQDSMWFIIIRNLILLTLLLTGIIATGYHRIGAHVLAETNKFKSDPMNDSIRPKAFTLIETLLVAVVLGILVAILLPVLGTVREKGRDVIAMSHLNQHASIFNMYADDWSGRLPAFAEQYATTTILRGERYTVSFPYFASNTFWQFALLDQYYTMFDVHDGIFLSPFQREYRLGDTPYRYSCSLIARPEYWNLASRSGRNQLRATRLSEVSYPSSKGLMSIDPWLINWNTDYPVSYGSHPYRYALIATCDGAVAKAWFQDLGETISTGDGSYDSTLGGHRVGAYPSAMHTQSGVRGRDLP